MKPSRIMGYAAMSKGENLQPFDYIEPELGEHEVRVAITHCGICGSDIQAIEDFYEITHFPLVPGHEIVGHVVDLGSAVTKLQIEDRVGIGWQARCCMKCEWCQSGDVNLCQEVADNGCWTPYGGFSSTIAVDENFAYKLPDGLPSESAAVLMCAGITVFKPLRLYRAEQPQRIGIIGIGGLGHLAIQYAKALGYEVIAISSSPEKKGEAITLGADQFLLADDLDALRRHTYYFDLLLATAQGGADWGNMMDILKKKGKLILVGFPEMTFKSTSLVAHELSIIGSFLGNQNDMREMLSFSQAHSIRPMVELMPMSQVNDAILKIKENKARYRIVLVNEG